MAFAVLRGEVLLHLHVADVDRRLGGHFIAKMQFGTAAPGQKLRIAFDAIDQHKHLFRRIRYENGFNNLSHIGRTGFTERAC